MAKTIFAKDPVKYIPALAEALKKIPEFEDGKRFLFECKVEGGTYIRKICSDLGEMIGGAH